MVPQEFYRLAQKYLDGTITPEEQRALDAETERRASALPPPTKQQETRERIWDQITQRTQPLPVKKRLSKVRFRYAATVAGLLLTIVGLWRFDKVHDLTLLGVATQKVTTGAGQQRSLILEDGTVVRLNANSSLEFKARFGRRSRRVHLQGEAYFEVEHQIDRPFIVSASSAQVRVVGTSFNVSSSSDSSVTVALLEGCVELGLSELGSPSVRLKPGEVARAYRDTISKRVTSVSNYTSWFNKRLVFDRTPLTEVARQLTELYQIQINVGSDVSRELTLTADLPRGSLDQVLANIAYTLNLQVTRQANTWVLSPPDISQP
jgi:ferric-dicitrate binding protein FerR (iron transport regulator)